MARGCIRREMCEWGGWMFLLGLVFLGAGVVGSGEERHGQTRASTEAVGVQLNIGEGKGIRGPSVCQTY